MAAWVFHFLTGCLVSCRHKLRLWLHPCNSPWDCQAGYRFPLLQLTFLQENFAFYTRLAVFLLRNRFVTQKIKKKEKAQNKTSPPDPQELQCLSKAWLELENFRITTSLGAVLVSGTLPWQDGGGQREKVSRPFQQHSIWLTFQTQNSAAWLSKTLLPRWLDVAEWHSPGEKPDSPNEMRGVLWETSFTQEFLNKTEQIRWSVWPNLSKSFIDKWRLTAPPTLEQWF